MAMEDEFEDVSGREQTRTARELCGSVLSNKRRHALQHRGGQFGADARESRYARAVWHVIKLMRLQSQGAFAASDRGGSGDNGGNRTWQSGN